MKDRNLLTSKKRFTTGQCVPTHTVARTTQFRRKSIHNFLSHRICADRHRSRASEQESVLARAGGCSSLVSVNRSGGNFTPYSHGHLPFSPSSLVPYTLLLLLSLCLPDHKGRRTHDRRDTIAVLLRARPRLSHNRHSRKPPDLPTSARFGPRRSKTWRKASHYPAH
ncbi:hypothetical protein ALC60_00871 [Trachymyrmex zeteki]|uniref:Uncharacterized protein n=1 Tax=Mycetomoellerius zeteki TaxID=64791 RepID=A0A151XID6_9HYME|nr:hypothetical protein ALC60_00871 [Trachymyrmex zeteki]